MAPAPVVAQITLPVQVPPCVQTIETGSRSASLDDVVGEDSVCRAQTVRATGHKKIPRIIDESVESNHTVVRPIMARQRSAVSDLSVTIADVDPNCCLKIIAEHLMPIAIDAHPGAVAKIIAIDKAVITVTKREFAAGRIDDRVIPVSVGGGLIGNELVFPSAAFEKIVLDQSESVRETQAAQTVADRLRAVSRPGW